jgi:hypothetical protein
VSTELVVQCKRLPPAVEEARQALKMSDDVLLDGSGGGWDGAALWGWSASVSAEPGSWRVRFEGRGDDFEFDDLFVLCEWLADQTDGVIEGDEGSPPLYRGAEQQTQTRRQWRTAVQRRIADALAGDSAGFAGWVDELRSAGNLDAEEQVRELIAQLHDGALVNPEPMRVALLVAVLGKLGSDLDPHDVYQQQQGRDLLGALATLESHAMGPIRSVAESVWARLEEHRASQWAIQNHPSETTLPDLSERLEAGDRYARSALRLWAACRWSNHERALLGEHLVQRAGVVTGGNKSLYLEALVTMRYVEALDRLELVCRMEGTRPQHRTHLDALRRQRELMERMPDPAGGANDWSDVDF